LKIGTEAATIPFVTIQYDQKYQVNAKYDQGNNAQLISELARVKMDEQEEANQEFEAYHKSGDKGSCLPVNKTEIYKGKFKWFYWV
jgi:hypothetical protein